MEGFLAFEHDRTKDLSSTIGGSYLGAEEKDFFPALQYIGGYKALINLFYKPVFFNRARFGAAANQQQDTVADI